MMHRLDNAGAALDEQGVFVAQRSYGKNPA